MKKFLLAVVASLLLACSSVHAQSFAYNGFGPPQGNCNPGTLGIDKVTATLYKCNTGGGWVVESSGGAFTGGNVPNFSAFLAGLSAQSVATTGPGAGTFSLGAGTPPVTIPSNAVTEGGPAAVTTAYYEAPPSGPPANDGNAYVKNCTVVSTSPYIRMSCNWVLPSSGGASLAGVSFADLGGGYTGITFNGSNANGTRLGFVGGGTGDGSLYHDVPVGGTYQFRFSGTVTDIVTPSGFVGPAVQITGSATQGASCTLNNSIVGVDSTHLYVCIGSVVKSATLN